MPNTTPTEDYLGNFKGKFNKTKKVGGLIERLSGNALESDGAREQLLADVPFQDEGQRNQVLIAEPHLFNPYAAGVYHQAAGALEDYFDAKKGEIIGALDSGKLEKLALNLKPTKLASGTPNADRHNGAIPLWEKHDKIRGANAAYDEDPKKAEAGQYNEIVAAEIKADPTLVIKPNPAAGPKEKEAWKHYGAASLKMALASGKFARVTGGVIQATRAKQFRDYFAEPNTNYSQSDFVRSNISYGDKNQAIGIIGELVNSK